jgi:hypothetical protein
LSDGGDEDEGFLDELGELANTAILTDTLMGWEGDVCECPDCDCRRFQDGSDDRRCPPCRVGEHWVGDAAEG